VLIDMLKKSQCKRDLLDKEQFIVDILIGDCGGNKTLCAKRVGVSRGYLYYYLNSDEAKAGSKLLVGVYNYAKSLKREPNTYFYKTEMNPNEIN
jgi:hypothetical protein